MPIAGINQHYHLAYLSLDKLSLNIPWLGELLTADRNSRSWRFVQIKYHISVNNKTLPKCYKKFFKKMQQKTRLIIYKVTDYF